MPHCIIEMTANLIPLNDCGQLMRAAAEAIHRLGCFSANDIKIRIRPVEYSYLGIVDQNHSYAAADVQVLNNKTAEQLRQLADSVQQTLMNHIRRPSGLCSLTTKITLLDADYYCRWLGDDGNRQTEHKP